MQNPDGSYTGQVDQPSGAGGFIARWRYTATALYQAGPLSTSLTQNFQKHYHDVPSSVTGVPRDVGNYITYDLQATYTGIKQVKLAGGVKNLFNRNPPYANYAGPANNFVGGYDLSYGDARGAFPYISGTYYFK